MEVENELKNRNFTISCSFIYDSLTFIISLCDVITDILILIHYYNNAHYVFAMLSLLILLIAQISYDITFITRYGAKLNKTSKILLFFIILPISPFLSFIFYWISIPNNKLVIIFNYFNLTNNKSEKSFIKNELKKFGMSKQQEYFQQKMVSHIGFIMESLIESFPQSILQSIAMICYYDQTSGYINTVIMISILLSLMSISSKALMFCGSLNSSMFLFNWLSVVTDFIGLYLIVTWVFYSPQSLQENEHSLLHLFKQIWLWKLFVSTICPVLGLTGLGMYIYIHSCTTRALYI